MGVSLKIMDYLGISWIVVSLEGYPFSQSRCHSFFLLQSPIDIIEIGTVP